MHSSSHRQTEWLINLLHCKPCWKQCLVRSFISLLLPLTDFPSCLIPPPAINTTEAKDECFLISQGEANVILKSKCEAKGFSCLNSQIL